MPDFKNTKIALGNISRMAKRAVSWLEQSDTHAATKPYHPFKEYPLADDTRDPLQALWEAMESRAKGDRPPRL